MGAGASAQSEFVQDEISHRILAEEMDSGSSNEPIITPKIPSTGSMEPIESQSHVSPSAMSDADINKAVAAFARAHGNDQTAAGSIKPIASAARSKHIPIDGHSVHSIGVGDEIHHVILQPWQVSDMARRNRRKQKARDEQSRHETSSEVSVRDPDLECDMQPADSVELHRWLGADSSSAVDDGCASIEAFLQLSAAQFQVTDIHARGGYAYLLHALSAKGESVLIKLLLISSAGDHETIGDAQFTNATHVQFMLQDGKHKHFKVPALHEVYQVKISDKTIGIEVMDLVDGVEAYDILSRAIENERDPGDKTVIVRKMAKCLSEFAACGYVHGDAHLRNFLIGKGGITIIDLDFASKSTKYASDVLDMLYSIGEVCDSVSKMNEYENLTHEFVSSYFDDDETKTEAFYREYLINNDRRFSFHRALGKTIKRVSKEYRQSLH